MKLPGSRNAIAAYANDRACIVPEFDLLFVEIRRPA